MTEVETPTPEPQSLDAGTTYIVMAQIKTPDADRVDKIAWHRLAEADARGADAAIRAVVGALPESKRSGTFVAIPARSFKPVTVSEKVERTLVIGA